MKKKTAKKKSARRPRAPRISLSADRRGGTRITCKKCGKRTPAAAYCGACGARQPGVPRLALGIGSAIFYYFFLIFAGTFLVAVLPQSELRLEEALSFWIFNFAIVLLILRVRKIAIGEAVFLRRANWSGFTGAILITAGASVLRIFATYFEMSLFPELAQWLERIWEEIAVFFMETNVLWGFFSIAITPAICEEVFCRGMLFSAFLRRMSPIRAILLSSVLFSLLHVNLSTTIIGIALAFIVYRTRSIFPAMLAHLLNNAFFYAALRLNWSYDTAEMYVADMPYTTILSALCLVAAGVVLLNHSSRGQDKRAFLVTKQADTIDSRAKKRGHLGRNLLITLATTTVIVLVYLVVPIIKAKIEARFSPGHGEHGGLIKTDYKGLPDEVTLSAEKEEFLERMGLTDAEMIKKVRYLLYGDIEVGKTHMLIKDLLGDERQEAKRAAIDLLASGSHANRMMLIREFKLAEKETGYFLRKVIEHWDELWDKEKAELSFKLHHAKKYYYLDRNLCDVVQTVVVKLLNNPGKMVPRRGIRTARKLDLLKRTRVKSAIKKLVDHPAYDYFKNVHPVRKEALKALGRKYYPPEREEVDFTSISIAEEKGMKKTDALSVGLITSLYTATGPCFSGRDEYGWSEQTALLDTLAAQFDTLVYCHPITRAPRHEISAIVKQSALKNKTILNSASITDLSLCDVVVLTEITNTRRELAVSLEEFVWKGGGIVTVHGAGIVTCRDANRLAALQDMESLTWNWATAAGEHVKEERHNPLTEGLDWSLPVQTRKGFISKNGYIYPGRKYKEQVLLRFEQMNEAALRVSRYGEGLVAHIAWRPPLRDDANGRRYEELLRRVILWAAAQEYTDFRVEPAISKERFAGVYDTHWTGSY